MNILYDDALFESVINDYESVCEVSNHIYTESGVGDVIKTICDGLNKFLTVVTDSICSSLGTTSNKEKISTLREAIEEDPNKGNQIIKIADVRKMETEYKKLVDIYTSRVLEIFKKMDEANKKAEQYNYGNDVKETISLINNAEKNIANMEANTIKLTVKDVVTKYAGDGQYYAKSVKEARENYRKLFNDATNKLKTTAGSDPEKLQIVIKISTVVGKATAMSFRGMLKAGSIAALTGAGIGLALVGYGQIKPDELKTTNVWHDHKTGADYLENEKTEKFNSVFAKMCFTKVKRIYKKGFDSKEFKSFVKTQTANSTIDYASAYAKNHGSDSDKKLVRDFAKHAGNLSYKVVINQKDSELHGRKFTVTRRRENIENSSKGKGE